MQADMNIGMLGHVDHGKTTLTKTLTGKWTDTHSEELKRGISIRLGYADCYIYQDEKSHKLYPTEKECKAAGGVGKPKLLRKLSIVDAPGHETLMTTVISATSILNGVLFLIAANEPCPQPQTAEHLLVLKATNLKNIIVVQTKIDLVTKEKATENYQQIKQFLKGTLAENAPIIPISAHYNLNIGALLAKVTEIMKPPVFDRKAQLRMFVSRSFDVNKPGSDISTLRGGVFGGSIIQGHVKVGDEIEIRPGVSKKEGAKPIPLITKVTSLMEETEKLDDAGPGGLVAVATALDPSLTKADSFVGSVAGRKGEVPEPLSAIKVKYSLLERKDAEGNSPLHEGEPLVINVHTATTVGLLESLNKGVATIRLKRPIVIYKHSTVALSRKIGQRWRLSAVGSVI